MYVSILFENTGDLKSLPYVIYAYALMHRLTEIGDPLF